MSYDLGFVHEDDAPPTTQDLLDHFRRRDWYEADPGKVRYLNSDTGVYFTFAWPTEEADVDAVPEVRFELSYARPRVFAEEAAEELAAFTEAFDYQVLDPQTDGSDPEPFDEEAFLESWNGANGMVAKQMVDLHEDLPFQFTLPTDEIRRVWQWNRNRRDYQESVGQSVFVPQMMLFEVGEELKSAVVWPDAVPLALPQVDFVLVSVPEQFSGSDEEPMPRRVEYDAFLESVDVEPESRSQPSEHKLLLWEEAPVELVRELMDEGTVATPSSMTGVPLDVIVDEDVVPDAEE